LEMWIESVMKIEAGGIKGPLKSKGPS